MSTGYFRNLVKAINDENTNVAADDKHSAEFSGYIDTGSYLLNALLSGTIYGGIPNNKITILAGETATGKTFFALGIAYQFLKNNPDGAVFYFDTESAVTRKMIEDRGIDSSRFIISEPDTIQKFRHSALKILEKYEATPEEDRPPMLFILDSIGQMSSTKEMEDTADGKETRDMTKAQVMKATFRVLGLRLAKVKVPLLCTNHVYAGMGMYATKEMSGGSGPMYAASTICFLSKSKHEEGGEVAGANILVTLRKSRFTREKKSARALLTHKNGLDRYFGLLELASKYDIIKEATTQSYEINGEKIKKKDVRENIEKYLTPEVLEQIDRAAAKEFLYGEFGGEEGDGDEAGIFDESPEGFDRDDVQSSV